MWEKYNTGQIRLQQKLGDWIRRYAANPAYSKYLEIGSWNGRGSTVCFAAGFSQRAHDYTFHSLEIHPARVEESKQFWAFVPNIQIVYGRVLSELPDVRTIHPEVNMDWHSEDERYFKQAPHVSTDAEVVLLDGGEYLTYFEYLQLKPTTKVFLLDDANVAKCKRIVEELSSDPSWTCIDSGNDRNGWAIFQKV